MIARETREKKVGRQWSWPELRGETQYRVLGMLPFVAGVLLAATTWRTAGVGLEGLWVLGGMLLVQLLQWVQPRRIWLEAGLMLAMIAAHAGTPNLIYSFCATLVLSFVLRQATSTPQIRAWLEEKRT